ncbi:MAG: 50S ribosomal protein L23 [Patescibacteria group bacterium]
MSLVNNFFDKILRKKEERKRRDARADFDASEPDRSIPADRESTVTASHAEGPTGDILLSGHQTEKTADGASFNQYAFVVRTGANKFEVGRAVENRYGVSVQSVAVLNMPGKERRRGRQIGRRPGFKKAIVKLKEGQKIEII